MPGYGIVGPDEGSGLLPWSWADERLTLSDDYWLATVWPDDRPHVTPVWGVWHNASLWFSCSLGSRKARNLVDNPRATATTDDARNPVVVEGQVDRIADLDAIGDFLARSNAKYDTAYEIDFLDPAINGTFCLRPASAFGLVESDFTGSPTRWEFAP